jgi:hypothetical protein
VSCNFCKTKIHHDELNKNVGPKVVGLLILNFCKMCSNMIELLCLVNMLTVEDEWLELLMIGPLLTMVIL